MKRNYFFLILLSLFIVSCSNDDDTAGDDPNNNNSPVDYIPLNNDDYWIYNVEGGATLNGSDSLYISNDTVINGNTYKKLKTKYLPLGFYSTSLSNNGVRKTNGKLLLSGVSTSGIPELPIEIDLTDFVIFDNNAAEGIIFSSSNGNIQQSMEGFLISIQYTLSSKAGESLDSYTAPNEIVYEDVKKVEIKLNMQITVTPEEFPIPFIILPSQDVIVSTQYYVNGIGMVHSSTDLEYQLSDTFGVELPLPQTMSQHQEEVLEDYHVN